MKFAYLRWMLRASVFWILSATLLGLAMLLAYRIESWAGIQAWRTVHVHALLVGGIIQVIMGVALWMFPRPPQSRGWPTDTQGWTLFALINTGTVLRTLSGPHLQTQGAWFWIGAGGAVLQVVAFLFFGYLIAPRIRGAAQAGDRR